jgi:tetratricopeptide (TPR) repeat protein
MQLTLDESLHKAIEAHNTGQIQEAERLYTAILKAQPKHPDANHNMGMLVVGVGKIQEATPFFKIALEANPSIGQFWLSYIDALIKLGRIVDAQSVLAEAKEKGVKGEIFDQLEQRLNAPSEVSADPPQDQLQPLINLYQQGQLQQTLDNVKKLLGQFPESVILHNISGAANAGLGQLDGAINSYQKALQIKPDFAEAFNNMGSALKNKGDFEAAIDSFKQALKIKPDYTDAYNNMGNALKDKGDLEAAIGSFKQALKIKPDYAEAYYNMGIALQNKDDAEAAIDSYQQALKINPDYAEAYNNMGNALKDKGDFEAAIDSFKQALKIKTNYAEAYNNMGVALQDKDDAEAAIDSYQQALKINPDYAEAYNNMGNAFKDKGDLEAAIGSFKQALKIKPDYAEAHHHLSSVTKYDELTQHVVQMQNLHQGKSITEEQRCHLSFALAKVFEDLNNLDESFSYLVIGNTLRKNQLGYDIKKDIELFRLLKNTYSMLKNLAPPTLEVSSEIKPIFILGMSRSGTTLVEQIVSSHSKITGAGELNYVAKFGAEYVTGLTKINSKTLLGFRKLYLGALEKHSNCRSIVTDKMPDNFKYIGLILLAFPEAQIIHVKRNSAATCWSNYKNYFSTKGLGHCYELNDLVTYYGLYKELMQFWQEEFGDRIYNLNYDNLTINQEKETRALLEHLGLQWEAGCLSPQNNKRSVRTASQQQVRQQVYQSSSQKWRKFEPFIGGAFDSLMELN